MSVKSAPPPPVRRHMLMAPLRKSDNFEFSEFIITVVAFVNRTGFVDILTLGCP